MEIGSLLNRHGALDHSSARRSTAIRISHSAPASPKPRIASVRRDPFRARLKANSREVVKPEHPAPSNKDSEMYEPSSRPTATAQFRIQRAFHPEASLVLVGIRGCGKRSLGFIAATALGRRFITEDHYFQSVTGLSRQDYLKTHGSQEFHKRDVEVTRRMLDDHKSKCVIECGLGSLTTSVQDHLKEYALTNPVVYLVRDMVEIKRLLNLDARSARHFQAGDPTHRRCSNFEFYNLEDHTTQGPFEDDNSDRRSPTYSFKLKDVKEDFSHFVKFITGACAYRPNYDSPFSLLDVPVDLRLYTHALEILFSDYEDGKVDLADLESGGDVLELCIDRWSTSATNTLSKMVAQARRKTGVPIVISVMRGHPNTSDDMQMSILEHGLRLGVEFLSVDLRLDNRRIADLVGSKGYTRIIGHWLEESPTDLGWHDDEWMSRYNRAEMLGCDIVRFLQVAYCREENERLNGFKEKVRNTQEMGPLLVAYNVGPLGRTSQVFNQVLTSVTHPALREISNATRDGYAPQISSKEIIQALFQSFVLDPLKFYILGANVSYSLSPAMHNAAYHVLGLNHTYKTMDITSLADLDVLAQDSHFGGASIVQPYKVAIYGQLASKSRHAEAIGAVNTLLPLRAQADGSVFSLQSQANQRNRAGSIAAWYGDNTDWIGIMVCINRNLSPRNVVKPSKTCGLVIGAGGMARAAVYAMLKLGCRNIFLCNRTISNAEAVAAHFNSWAGSTNGNPNTEELVKVLRSTEEPWPSSFDMPTMIVSTVTHRSLNGKPAANFEMPPQWLGSSSGGVVVDMAYKPVNTPLVKQIRSVRKATGVPWVVVDGIEILPEQAIAQFELMTGRKAPRGIMRAEILRACQDGVMSEGDNGNGG
jgi:3-dehydroquinate dehydratase type I